MSNVIMYDPNICSIPPSTNGNQVQYSGPIQKNEMENGEEHQSICRYQQKASQTGNRKRTIMPHAPRKEYYYTDTNELINIIGPAEKIKIEDDGLPDDYHRQSGYDGVLRYLASMQAMNQNAQKRVRPSQNPDSYWSSEAEEETNRPSKTARVSVIVGDRCKSKSIDGHSEEDGSSNTSRSSDSGYKQDNFMSTDSSQSPSLLLNTSDKSLLPQDQDSRTADSFSHTSNSTPPNVTQRVFSNKFSSKDGLGSSIGSSLAHDFDDNSSSLLQDLDEDKEIDNTTENTSTRKRVRQSDYVYNPKPVGIKSIRKFVSGEQKDDKYWSQRVRNNMAARKSREARRQKEIETLKVCYELQKENQKLKTHITQLETKALDLEKKVELYDKMMSNENILFVKV